MISSNIEKLFLAVSGVRKKMQKEISASKQSLAMGEFIFLKRIVNAPCGITLKELTACAEVDKAYTTRIIKKMEQRGLIKKQIQNLSQKKFKILATKQGMARFERVIKKHADHTKNMLSVLTEKEFQMLIKILNKIAA